MTDWNPGGFSNHGSMNGVEFIATLSRHIEVYDILVHFEAKSGDNNNCLPHLAY